MNGDKEPIADLLRELCSRDVPESVILGMIEIAKVFPARDGQRALMQASLASFNRSLLDLNGTTVSASANGDVRTQDPAELELAPRRGSSLGSYSDNGTAQLAKLADQPNRAFLTERQAEILTLIAHGQSSKEIGGVLGLSAKTVDVHRARIMARLNIHDVAGLVRYAMRIGLV